MKKIWELLDEAKEAHEKMREAWDEKAVLSESQIVGWIDQNLHLLEELARKVEELEERLDGLKAETTTKKKSLFRR